MYYRPEVDGLRAIAAVPVILFHAGIFGFSGGFVGVDIFFVISGYLIGTIIIREIEDGSFSILRFYERRARRILPALFAVLIITLPVALILMYPPQLVEFGQNLVGAALSVSNITLWQQGGYFGGPAELKPLLHTWSLAVEEQFYLVFPLLSLCFLKVVSIRSFFGFILLLSLGSLVLAEWASLQFQTASFYFLPTRAWEIGAGVLVALCLLRRAPLTGCAGHVLSVIGLGALVFSIGAFDEATRFPSLVTLIPVLGTCAVLLAAQRSIVGRLLSLSVVVGIGLISYSTYLWHQPVFAFFRVAVPSLAHSTYLFLFLSVISIGLGWLSWRFIERPFRHKDQISRAYIFKFSCAGIVVASSVGAYLIATQGFLSLYPKEDRTLLSMTPAKSGEYVRAKYMAQAAHKPINPDVKTVMLIGDSFSQDFYNMMLENGAFHDYDIVARPVSARCQIYFGQTDVVNYVGAENIDFCSQSIGRLTSQIINQSKDADIVLLVGSWLRWSARYIAQTVAHFERTPGKDIFVVGRKSFEANVVRELIQLDQKERVDRTVTTPDRLVEANKIMMNANLGDGFINVYELFCNAQYKCKSFSPEGELLSTDGAHLTPAVRNTWAT